MNSFKELLNQAKQSDAYWIEKAVLEFTSDIHSEMKRQHISNSELASMIGASPAYITKIFNGSANFTIKSMVKLSRALNSRLHIRSVHESKKLSYASFPYTAMRNTSSDAYNNSQVPGYDAITLIA